MEFQSYNAELAIANLLFKRIFDNIRIERTNSKGEKKQLKVQCVLGQRSRIIKNLENPEKRGNMKVPMIVINRTGYARNGERLNNMHNEIKYEMTSSYRNKNIMTPVPVDISYDVSIIAKYPEDLDKIASNFMIFFNPDIYVSAVHPKFEGIKMNNQIIMGDSVSEDHPDEFDSSQDDLISNTFNFTYKTFLFSGTEQAKLIRIPISTPVISTQTYVSLSDVLSVIDPTQIDDYQKKYPTRDITAVIKADKIDDFQKICPTTSVSALVEIKVESTVSSYIKEDDPDPETEIEIYDSIPPIYSLDFGFYNVPNAKDFDDYMTSVDNEMIVKHEHFDLSGEMVNVLSDGVFCTTYYDIVDNRCTLEPFVDKIYWKVDGRLNASFPNNVGWFNDRDVQ